MVLDGLQITLRMCFFTARLRQCVPPPWAEPPDPNFQSWVERSALNEAGGNERTKELRNEGTRVGTVAGLGDGGQPLLSASIRTPRGDMNAGEEERKGGGRTETSHPLTLKYVRMSPYHICSQCRCLSLQLRVYQHIVPHVKSFWALRAANVWDEILKVEKMEKWIETITFYFLDHLLFGPKLDENLI